MAMATVTNDCTQACDQDPWQLIAGLKFRLRDQIKCFQQVYRGQQWLVIVDPLYENYFRCSETVRQFLSYLDGSRTTEQAFSIYLSKQPGLELSRDEVVTLIAKLKAAELLEHDGSVTDIGYLVKQAQQLRHKQRWQRWLRPFAIKIPLLDPNAFLTKTLPVVLPCFKRLTLLFWGIIVAWAVVLCWLDWQSIELHWQSRFMDPSNLVWLWLLYPIIKALHELGHAYCTKAFGGAVHEMGLMLLVFIPVPYVDSTVAYRFSSKQQRMLVAAAGIIVEVALAAIALICWSAMEPGFARDIAFNIVVIGGVSTLLFNGNPLMRFDGYYVLSDFLEMPNLSSRANQYVDYLLKRYLLKLTKCTSPVSASNERLWLVSYGLCAGIYRIIISFSIAFWIATQFFVLGVLLAVWFVFSLILVPFFIRIKDLIEAVKKENKMTRLTSVFKKTGLILFILLLVPVRTSTVVEGVISLPEQSLIRAQTNGFIEEIFVENGQQVTVGTPLFRLENHELSYQLAVWFAKKKEIKARLLEILIADRAKAQILDTALSAVNSEITEIERQLKQLTIISPSQGKVALNRVNDLQGRYLKKGMLIGYVIDWQQVNARVIVEQADIDDVLENTRSIHVKMHSNPSETFIGSLIRSIPKATDQLPSPLLGSLAGGDVAVDVRDSSRVKAISKVFELDIALPTQFSGDYFGQRMSVRFIHGYESLGKQIFRPITIQLLNFFEMKA